MHTGHFGRTSRGLFMTKRLLGLGLVTAVLVGASIYPLDAAGQAGSSSGLKGVLPASVPEDLTEAVAALPPSWTEWGTALSADLATLYEKGDAAGQRAAIASLRHRLATIETALGNPQYQAAGDSLVQLHGQVKRHTDLAEAALDTLEASAATKGPLTELLAALEQYDTSRSKTDSAAARKAYDAVRAAAADGGEKITAVLRTHYLNYNMRVVASEAFLNKFVRERRNETGPVDDFILCAKVDGCQTTVTDVCIKLVPSVDTARFDIIAEGSISSSTQGVTDKATVFTQGNHWFQALKEVDFNGETFWTQPARIGVNANNYTTGAQTNINLPIFGAIANRIAVMKAEQMRPESEAIAVGRVQDRVLPEFNNGVDNEFGPAGKSNAAFNRDVVTPLKDLQLFPDAKHYSTTSSHLRILTRLMENGELGGHDAPPALGTGKGASLLLHDSVMNNGIDRLNIKGRTMTEDELNRELESKLGKLLGRTYELSPPKANEEDTGPKTMVFDGTDPIRFRAAEGSLYLTIRAGFKQEGKEDIPPQIITLPINFTVQGESVIVDHGPVEVSAVTRPANPAIQISRAGVIKKKMELAFPRRELARAWTFERDGKKVNANVTSIKSLDGWISINVE